MSGLADIPEERGETRRGEPARFASGPVSDDSYEAAMRAADALFSSPASRTVTPPPSPSGYGDAQPDFDEPGFGAPRETATDARTPGRILPAMDRPEVDPFAELEAERAPKRRGRKPGSKNKPKIPALVTQQPVAAFTAGDQPFDEDRSFDEDPSFAEDQSLAGDEVQGESATIVPSVPGLLAPAPRATTSRTRGENRFAWVRTRLKPGQKWKRRLPKVAW